MIDYWKKPFTMEESLDTLNIFVRKWFEGKYKELTPPQKYSLKLLKDRQNMLITAPTGSGKTFSAFIGILSDLMNQSLTGKLEEKVYCIYVSPLRALNNDIHRNLSVPLEEIYSNISIDVKKITVGIRTGDTPQKERQRMLAHPPNILITTPESLAIMINSERFVENLKEVKYFIVDELHELANNKRGVHLSLSIERLVSIIGHDFLRIGLGATLHPLEEAARYLVGYDGEVERSCYIVDATWDKQMDYIAICPVKDIINASDQLVEGSIYKMLDSIIKKNKTTLIFTNTRSGTERVVYNLQKRYKYNEDSIAAHHGSLSREIRLGVEDMLKKGKLKVAVSSTSLELGIDIGTIDNVIQIGSPKSVARAIQRIGRSGHSFNDVARGEVVVTNRDDLVECSVMLDAAKKRHMDSFTTPKNALDVLAQHIVGMSQTKKWSVDEAFAVIRNSYPYHTLSKRDFISLLEYLSGMYVGLESRRVYAKIWYEEKGQTFGRRGKLTKLIYFLNLGTIPDEVAIDVVDSRNKWIGSIQEEFLAKLKPGDIFVLGGKSYRFEFSRVMKAFVSDASGQIPTIPPWYSEQLPLTYELALEIGRFREQLGVAVGHSIEKNKKILALLDKSRLKPNEEAKKILDQMPIDENAKNSIFNYFAEQMMYAGYIPNDRFLLVEKTVNEEQERNIIVFHSLYGRRINDALSRIIAIEIGDRYDTDVGVNITDNGFVIATEIEANVGKKELSDIIGGLASMNVRELLRQNIRRSEMMKRRFRYVAARSFMILRNYKGRKISVRKQQVSSQFLLKASEEISQEFPVLKETYREIFDDVMDLPRTEKIIQQISSGEITYRIIETVVPSPFSHLMITFGEADMIMMKDRRRHLRQLHKLVLARMKKMV
jgi:ATP-dependent helicase Lhr and Lhr-like helicase